MFRLLILLSLVLPLLAQDTVVSIRSFSVQQTTASVQVTLNLDNAISTTTGCFFDKLTFVSDSTLTQSTMTFTPDNPGICEHSSSSSTVLTGTMDIRDYINAISFEILTSVRTSYIITGPAPVSLLPGVMVEAISDPLQSIEFTESTVSPNLVSFDLDLTTNVLLLHFDALMDAGSLTISELMFSGTPTSPQAISLLSLSIPSNRYTTTLCISVSQNDIRRLEDMNICMGSSSCYCHFSSSLISDSRNNPVNAITSSSRQKVTKLRTSTSRRPSPLFMRLSLSYIGCTAVHTLAEDEVFVLRPFESVSSINCSFNGQQNSSNNRPQILRLTSFSGSMDATITDYVFYDWPLTTYLGFTSGLPSELYGQYVCTSSQGTRVRTYVHNNVSNIELPSGTMYSLPLKAPLTIPLYFGTYPSINLLQDEVMITLTGTPEDARIERRNPYHVDIRYLMVENALSGSYVLQISDSSGVIATRPITIDVTPPTLTLLPEVATILPGQTELQLMCTVNSNALQVTWFSGSMELRSGSTITVQLPTDNLEYTCSAVDSITGTVEASGVVRVRNVQEILSVWQEGVKVANNSLIEVVNRRSGDLSLQCIEHVGTSATNLAWMVLPDNGSLIIPMTEDDETYRATISGNQANLTIDNSVEPFRGLLKCISSSGQVISVRVVEDASLPVPVCQGEEDSVWEILWNQTLAGRRDFQPCPPDRVSRLPTNGVAIRQCGEDGEWNGTVDISDCSSENFINLQNMAADIFNLRNAYTQSELSSRLADLITQLELLTRPKATTYFPRDIDVVNDVLDGIVDVLLGADLGFNHVQIVNVFDNLLRENNINGWATLSEMNDAASSLFLSSLEGFGVALLESLLDESATVEETNIVMHAMTSSSFNQSLTYPANTDSGAQVMIPAALLQRLQATGVVYTIIRNIDDILPDPDDMLLPESNQLRVASTIVSTQIINGSGLIMGEEFSDEEAVSLEIVTDMVSRAVDPFCVFWDANENQWSQEGVETVLPATQIQSGETKQFSVNCLSKHLTAFGVAVDVNTDEFNFSIPVYVGCGCIIFSSILSLFSLFLSWACDKLRKHSIVSFFVHMSFIASLFCAFVAFLAGIEQALNDRIGCVAVAGLLHYFFTAAFCWLLCEGVLLVFFRVFSQYYGLCLIMFLLGWGLPAIPTAISLGILHESYGTATQCWFFFDGIVSDSVVLGFILPKLFIIAATLLLLFIGCCTNCKFSNKKMQPYLQASLSRVLWLIWASICIFLVFLIAVWVFALLLVNVYGIDSTILGWVFMIACIIMSVWMFVFSVVTMVINQKVDYERVWSSGPDPVYPLSDVGRGKGYEFMSRPAVDLSGRRTSTLTRASGLSNPVFGTENAAT